MDYGLKAYLLDISNVHFVDSHDGHVLLLRFQQHSILCRKIQYHDVDANDYVFVDLVFELMEIQLVYIIRKNKRQRTRDEKIAFFRFFFVFLKLSNKMMDPDGCKP